MKSPAQVMHEVIDCLYELIACLDEKGDEAIGETRELEGDYYLEIHRTKMIFLKNKESDVRILTNTFGTNPPPSVASVVYYYIIMLDEDGYWK